MMGFGEAARFALVGRGCRPEPGFVEKGLNGKARRLSIERAWGGCGNGFCFGFDGEVRIWFAIVAGYPVNINSVLLLARSLRV